MPYKSKKAQNKATNAYKKKATIQLNIKLFKTSDASIIEHLKTISNKRQYIIELIRKDMEEK